MAGRKRQAVAVLELSGRSNLTKSQKEERRAQEITVPQGEFIPPDTLTEVQKEDFYEIVEWMQSVNSKNKAHGAIYCDRDSEGIAQYIICRDLAHEYQKLLVVFSHASNAELEKHYSSLHLKYCDMARKYSSDIGLDYLSRMKRAGPLPDNPGGDDYGGF